MGNIRVLADDVIGKIAAGEVVERPASVVKELVENAIDAGSDSIEVEVIGAGTTLVRIADNGSGMAEEDALISVARHATSKIKNVGDLEHTVTLGFRGEALASIAGISQFEMTTRAEGAPPAMRFYFENGKLLKKTPAPRVRGTTIEVRNLFYNVPARKKFLKKETTELAAIIEVVGRFILSHPDIEFKLINSGREIFHAPRHMDVPSRMELVMGSDVARGMIVLPSCGGQYRISGYVSAPSFTCKNKEGQFFFVNKRFVRSLFLSGALQDAYASLVERQRYPACVISIDVDPSHIDVNVHPMKLLVKFDDERSVKEALVAAVGSAFEGKKTEKKAGDESRAPETAERKVSLSSEDQTEFKYDIGKNVHSAGVFEKEKNVYGESLPGYLRGASTIRTEAAAYYGDLPAGRAGRPPRISSGRGPVFQIAGCYIAELRDDRIVLTDQHAAHERIMYEYFLNIKKARSVESQNMLFPERLDVSAEKSAILAQFTDKFRSLGFDIESFGRNSFLIRSFPSVLKAEAVKEIVSDMLSDLSSGGAVKLDSEEELVKMAACRSAVKAGDKMREEEMTGLLDQLENCELPFTCPHGRPVSFEITVDEMERRFHRK